MDSIFGSRAVSGATHDPPGGALHFLIKSNMKREYLKQKKERKKLAQKRSKKLVKPEMSEVSQERFQIFKEEIRQNLYKSEDYMFSDVKELREGLPQIFPNNGPEDQSIAQKMPSANGTDATKNDGLDSNTDLQALDEELDQNVTE